MFPSVFSRHALTRTHLCEWIGASCCIPRTDVRFSNAKCNTDSPRCHRDANVHFHPEPRVSRHINALAINTSNRDSIIAAPDLIANPLLRRTSPLRVFTDNLCVIKTRNLVIRQNVTAISVPFPFCWIFLVALIFITLTSHLHIYLLCFKLLQNTQRFYLLYNIHIHFQDIFKRYI